MIYAYHVLLASKHSCLDKNVCLIVTQMFDFYLNELHKLKWCCSVVILGTRSYNML